MNAGALWDIFDDKNDDPDGKDTLSDPLLEKIWTISRDYKPENILDFWNDWFNKYDYEEQMHYIFETHEIPQQKPEPEPPANRPPVADAGEDITVYQTCAEGAEVYLSSENSYDPDGDELKDYRWYAGWSGGWARSRGPDATMLLPPGETTVTLYLSDGLVEVSDDVVVTVIATDPSTWDEP
jgi:hypothetical protein